MDKIVSNENNIDNIKASKENFAQLLEESFSKENKKVGGLVKGKVVAIEKDTVLIDIGFKISDVFGQRQRPFFKNYLVNKIYNKIFNPDKNTSPNVSKIKLMPRYFIIICKK